MRAPMLTGAARWDAFNAESALVVAEGPRPQCRGADVCGLCGEPVRQDDPCMGLQPHTKSPPQDMTVSHSACHTAWWAGVVDRTWARIEARLATGLAA